jgi:hypothetical protein
LLPRNHRLGCLGVAIRWFRSNKGLVGRVVRGAD